MRAQVMSTFGDAFLGRNCLRDDPRTFRNPVFHENNSVDDDRIVACRGELDDAIGTLKFQMIISVLTT